ncbi:hypothetical protein SFR_6968 (plasmid) [Streptomyces sp. FR-008]|nr:hypothetical protein SFR_6968 [Streptomyces sp. FR-008]
MFTYLRRERADPALIFPTPAVIHATYLCLVALPFHQPSIHRSKGWLIIVLTPHRSTWQGRL